MTTATLDITLSDRAAKRIARILSKEPEGTVFTPRGTREVNVLFERATDMLECAGDLTLTGNRVLARHVEIESLRFGGKATLFTGEGDAEGIEGIATPSGSYDLTAKWLDNRLVFSFRDKGGHTGTLALARPNTVSVFEVDPRDVPDRGHGPTLYKEWKLSAPAAGSGVFAPGASPRQVLTLIFQGHGNSCTSSIDFSHWTLVMQGPKANYTLFGNLVTTK